MLILLLGGRCSCGNVGGSMSPPYSLGIALMPSSCWKKGGMLLLAEKPPFYTYVHSVPVSITLAVSSTKHTCSCVSFLGSLLFLKKYFFKILFLFSFPHLPLLYVFLKCHVKREKVALPLSYVLVWRDHSSYQHLNFFMHYLF